MYTNNMMYRPTELEHIACYEMATHYELRKITQKKIESLNHIAKGKTSFDLLEIHSSHKCMIMVKRTNILIPCINFINLLPNIVDFSIDNITTEVHILKKREEYAKIILLLFYPYRI